MQILRFKQNCLSQSWISSKSIMQLTKTIFHNSAIFIEKKWYKIDCGKKWILWGKRINSCKVWSTQMKTSAAQTLLIRWIPVFLMVMIVPMEITIIITIPPSLQVRLWVTKPNQWGLNYVPESGPWYGVGFASPYRPAFWPPDRATGPDPNVHTK